MSWGVRPPIVGSMSGGTPVVSVSGPRLRVDQVRFCDPALGSNFSFLYQMSDTHGIATEPVQWWARGAKIEEAEWVRGRAETDNYRACLYRNRAVSIKVCLKMEPVPGAAMSGTITATPKLDNSTAFLTPPSAPVSFTYPAGAAEHWITMSFGGTMPDEVGRFLMRLDWQVTGVPFDGPPNSQLRVYAIYDTPFLPGHDSSDPADAGARASSAQGTLTGTRKRTDKLMQLLGSNLRHAAASANDVIDILWKLHQGINDRGDPPYFDAGHDEHITHNGHSSGTAIDVEDQWLMWAADSTPEPDPGHLRGLNWWNDGSCIGHVQLLKTMAASIGLYCRRAWVFPHTTRLPDGSTVSFSDTDLYALGQHDSSKKQWHTFQHNGSPLRARVVLMEPNASWENFEACLRSPSGKFLPGGYATSRCPASFRSQKGFNSAAELIAWWAGTSRSGFGRRFQAWAASSPAGAVFFDVDGTAYTSANYTQIRDRGKELPPP